jgi:hypothetical protein
MQSGKRQVEKGAAKEDFTIFCNDLLGEVTQLHLFAFLHPRSGGTAGSGRERVEIVLG